MKKFLAKAWDIAVGVVVLYIALQVVLYSLNIQIVPMP